MTDNLNLSGKFCSTARGNSWPLATRGVRQGSLISICHLPYHGINSIGQVLQLKTEYVSYAMLVKLKMSDFLFRCVYYYEERQVKKYTLP